MERCSCPGRLKCVEDVQPVMVRTCIIASRVLASYVPLVICPIVKYFIVLLPALIAAMYWRMALISGSPPKAPHPQGPVSRMSSAVSSSWRWKPSQHLLSSRYKFALWDRNIFYNIYSRSNNVCTVGLDRKSNTVLLAYFDLFKPWCVMVILVREEECCIHADNFGCRCLLLEKIFGDWQPYRNVSGVQSEALVITEYPATWYFNHLVRGKEKWTQIDRSLRTRR